MEKHKTTRARNLKECVENYCHNLITKEDHQVSINTNSPYLSFTNLEMQDTHNTQGGYKENKDQIMGDAQIKEVK